MRISYRKLAFWIIIVVVLVFIFANPQVSKTEISYKVETVSRACTFEQTTEEDIRAVGNSIVITMPFETPTPCYDVVGKVDIVERDIKVDLKLKAQEGACIQCLGTVVGKVTISGLDKGIYGLQINTPQRAAITTIMIE